MSTPNLQTQIGPLTLDNPIMLASGTCGYGQELEQLLDLDRLGAIVVKGISLEPRPGNPPPRIIETPCGLLNAIGLENIGVRAFLKEKLPWLRNRQVKVVVNILGNTLEEYRHITGILGGAKGIDAIEVNISCPNVKAGGVAFGTDPQLAGEVTRAVVQETDLPVIVKLSPNVTDICAIAQAVEQAGADAISLINTLLAMAIDIENRRPALGNIFGGLSGPAIKPVALRMVWQVARCTRLPIIGIGGIASARDAIEFIMAGAWAVQIGTATLVEPGVAEKILNGIIDFMVENNYQSIEQLWIRD